MWEPPLIWSRYAKLVPTKTHVHYQNIAIKFDNSLVSFLNERELASGDSKIEARPEPCDAFYDPLSI